MAIRLIAPFPAFAAQNIKAFELSAEEEHYLDTIRDTPISLAITSELDSFINLQGERSGLLQPLIGLMEDRWGLKVEIVNPGWGEAFNMLDSGEVDLLGLAILSDKRRSVYNSTEALYNSNMDIYTRSEVMLESIVELEGKNVGLLSDSMLPEMLEVYLTPEGSIKYYKTVDELITAVEREEVFCAASSLAIQNELLDHPDVNYEMSVESVITPQCIYSNSERLAPLLDLINRYLAAPEGVSMVAEINSNRRKCTLEKYREFYKDDVAYIKENYEKLQIFDSGVLYPLSYVQNGKYCGLQNEINGILYELTGVSVEILDYSSLGGIGDVIDALKNGEILAVAGIHRINEYSHDASLEYSLPLMTDTLSFYVRQNNTVGSLSEMRIGSLDFGGSYMDFRIIAGKNPQIYASRNILIEDLQSNKLDAVFIGEMLTDYYYTVLNDYTLKRFDNLTVPASVHLLYNSDNGSFNRLMNTAVELQAIVDPANRNLWSNNSQNGKFELMWLKTQMNLFQAKMITVTVLLIIVLAVLLSFVIYQLRKFSNFDRQISRMLSVQGNADMLWGNLKNDKLISKGDYPISKKLGLSKEIMDKLMDADSLKNDIKTIDGQGLPYYMRDIELKPENSDMTYFFRRFTHKIDESGFMVYLMDFTAEKYHERELSKLANTDHLTKLLNRRAMDKRILKMAAGLTSGSGRIFMFMLDIDDFKRINDAYGHDIGDKVLSVVAGIIEKVLSKGNVARWGGEEFFGIAELESHEKAMALAQKILHEFESTEITVGVGKYFHSTISCGVAELADGEAYTDAVTRADKALYQAKFDGKNCVRFFGRDSNPDTVLLDSRSGETNMLDVSVTYNRTMSRIVHAFFHSRGIDTVIMQLLKITVECNGLDRAFVLEKTDDGIFERTYVYDPMDLASASFLSVITAEEIARMGKFSLSDQRFVQDAVVGISEMEREVRSKGLKSFAELPIFANDSLIGLVVFENCHETHVWTNDERGIFGDLSVVLGEFIIRKGLEIKLMRSNAAMTAIFDSIDDIVYVVEFGTRELLFANKKMRDDTNNNSYKGKTCWEVIRPDLGGPCGFCMHDCFMDESGKPENNSIRHEVYNELADKWFDVTDTVTDWENGKKAVVMFCRDITDSKLYEQRLSERAYKDSLTGLLNKQYLSDGLIKPLSGVFENFGGILFDIKSFKNINEAFGYDYGDMMIRNVSGRLREFFSGGTVLRISGNRFLAVLENTSVEELEDYAKKVLDEFGRPVLTDKQMVRVNFKIGIAVSADADLTKLLKDAEIALYSAKESPTQDYRVLSDPIRLAFKKKANMEFELIKAIERQEFVMYYQPEVLAGANRVVGAEALIRWRHPELGTVLPLDFIPFAEETGQIIPIGEFVINESARQLRRWLDDGFDMFLSFNLSAKQFLSPHLKSNIYTAMKKYRIPHGSLVIEITESTMISDFEHVRQVLEELNSFGVGISLDDFGTGYSSMNYLGKIPLDYLKIDKSFINNATTVRRDRAILESIVTMSHKLGFKVTAEGVETAGQFKMLKGLDCDIIQGYYFSEPLSREGFEEYVKTPETLRNNDCLRRE